MKIRALLEQEAESRARATELPALVLPLCSEPKEREGFLETAAWSASFAEKDYRMVEVLAAEVIEHVATTCLRIDPAVSLELVEGGKKAVPGQLARFSVMEARFRATTGDLAGARIAAERARALGSFHAIALVATLQAEEARASGSGYRPGMFDAALATLAVEPDGTWPLIDLTAVISTRARLLTERALWEDGEQATATRRLAGGLYRRLSVAPFVDDTRRRALDVACFESADLGEDARPACGTAATETGNLGAAMASGAPVTQDRFDLARKAKLEGLRDALGALGANATVVLVARGDEQELVEWARPAARLFGALVARKVRLVVVDRTSSPRASALLARMLALAGAEPALTIPAGRDTLAMPCVAAVLARRQTPRSCPLPAPTVAALERFAPTQMAVLVGRDLDAELDDLRLYEARSVLLSFRLTEHEKHLFAWLKSLSDVLIPAPLARAEARP